MNTSGLSRNVDWLQSLKQFFINVSYNILEASLTLRVRLATSIWYDTLIKICFKDWSQSSEMLHVKFARDPEYS